MGKLCVYWHIFQIYPQSLMGVCGPLEIAFIACFVFLSAIHCFCFFLFLSHDKALNNLLNFNISHFEEDNTHSV